MSTTIRECEKTTAPDTGTSEDCNDNSRDMAESAAVTVIATETRNLRVLPFQPTKKTVEKRRRNG